MSRRGGRRGGTAGGPGAARGLAAALLLAGVCGLACSTGDPDPEPADTGGRILRTPARVDSQLSGAREHIGTIDTLGSASE